MENKLKFWFIQFFIVGVLLSLQAQLLSAEPKFPCYFIFGDSLVDTGNNNNLNTRAKVNYFPYGIDFPQGPTGRFTNGRNIADLIGELLGFKNYIPPYKTARNQDVLTGVNYGSGAAGILNETGYQMGTVISLNKQLVNHRVTMLRIAALHGDGGEKFAKEHLSKCIYTVSIGSNDYLNNYYLPKFYSSRRLYTPEQFAEILIGHYSKQLRQLYNYGARKVAVHALGRLGCCPAEVALYGATNHSLCAEPINKAAKIFNDKLKQLLDRFNYRFADANFIYINTVIDSYGNIKFFRTPCCVLSDSTGLCLPGAVTCKNRDGHMFWDGFHPTEAANLLSAEKIYHEMSPLFTNLIDDVN